MADLARWYRRDGPLPNFDRRTVPVPAEEVRALPWDPQRPRPVVGRRRDEVRRLEEKIRRAQSSTTKLNDARNVLDRQHSEFKDQAHELDRWYRENALQLSQYREVVSELNRRETSRIVAMRSATPRYIIDLIGEEPRLPAERARWTNMVTRIEQFRSRWRIKDNERALGGETRSALQRAAREELERAVSTKDDLDSDISLERRSS